jgi:subtilase family serine protease
MSWKTPQTWFLGKPHSRRRRSGRRTRRTGVESLEIRQLPAADLRAVLVNAPATLSAGQSSTVSTAVSNTDLVVSGAYAVRFFASQDDVLSSDDRVLKTVNRSGIAARTTVQWNESLRIPADLPPGTWRIIMQVDPLNVLRESDESNNVAVDQTPSEVIVPPTIDIRGLALSVPPSAIGGTSVPVATSISNAGNTATGTFQVSYYLSTDPTITAADRLLKTITINSLQAGEILNWSESVDLPANLATGTWYVGIILDSASEVVETAESNNTFASTAVRITAPVIIDLSPTSISSPSAAHTGDTISVQTSVTNTGTSPSGTYTVRYYLGSSETAEASDRLLKSVTRSSLAGSGVQTWSESLLIPADLTAGNWFIRVVVDPDNAIGETDETNNTLASAAISLTILPPVDLRAVSLTAPTSLQGGAQASLTATVSNQGTMPSGAFQVSFYLSTDGTIATNDRLLKTVTIDSLGPNGQIRWSELVDIPENVPGGSYFLGILIDPANEIAESVESNNVLSTASTRLTPRPLIDLTATSILIPSSAYAGYPIAAQVSVRNNGTSPSGTYTVRYYLDSSEPDGASNLLLKTVSRISLAANSVQSWTETLTLPADLAVGSYIVRMMIDPDNALRETDETNNTLSSVPIAVTIFPPVDLRAVSLGAPYSVQGGAAATLTATIANLGTAASGTFQVSYYLSTDNQITTDDRLLKTITMTSILSKGQIQWLESIDLADDLPSGYYYFGVAIDPADEIVESVETNNRAVTAAVRLTAPPKIDLEATAVSTSPAGVAGSGMAVQTTVSNLGYTPSGTYKVNYLLRSNDDAGASDILIKSVTRASVAGYGVQSWTETLTLPSTLQAGSYEIVITVDPANAVVETNESNNSIASADVVISVPPPNDLRALTLTAPTTAVTGSTIALTARVGNQGTVPSGSFEVSYYLSTDNVITADDLLIKTIVLNSIAIGGQQQWSELIDIAPELATGTWYFGILVDPADSIPESIETNNVAVSGAVRMTAPPAINLAAAGLQAVREAYAGSTLSVQTAVSNLGSSPTGTYKVNYYLSTSSTVATSDLLLKSVTRASIAAGGSQNWTELLTLPANLSPGNYYIGVIVDPADAIRETDESNNLLASEAIAVTVLPPVDLRGVSLTGPATILRGSTASITTTVGNLGTAASGAFNVSYYISSSNTVTTADRLLKTVSSVSISARGQRQWVEQIVIPGDLAPGTYYVGMIVDPANDIVEASESNNVVVAALMRVTEPQVIDLRAISFDAPTTAVAGTTMNVSTTVANGGNATSGTYKVNYYLSVNDSLGTSDYLLKSVTRTALAGAASQTWIESLGLPVNLAAGTYRIGILVDPTNAIRETDESNNGILDAEPLTITLPATGSGFQITLSLSGFTSSQVAIFHQATARWSEIIRGDIPDVLYNGVLIDDLRISARARSIDGVGRVLGQAGPTAFRAGTSLPYLGMMEFDSADMANMEQNGTLLTAVFHEIGHILGFGTIWTRKSLLAGAGGAAPTFLGKQATAVYNDLFHANAAGVPVEGNSSGVGSRDSHWSETAFRNEVMSPYLSGATHPASQVTIASMADLGYVVDLNAADAFLPSWATPPASISAAGSTGGMASLQLLDDDAGNSDLQPDNRPCGCGFCVGAIQSPTRTSDRIAQAYQAIANLKPFDNVNWLDSDASGSSEMSRSSAGGDDTKTVAAASQTFAETTESSRRFTDWSMRWDAAAPARSPTAMAKAPMWTRPLLPTLSGSGEITVRHFP